MTTSDAPTNSSSNEAQDDPGTGVALAPDTSALSLPPEAASYEGLLALAQHRRSVRAFNPDLPVSEQTVDKIIDVARWSPSAGNGQPWEFVVIRDDEMREKIAELYSSQLAEKRDMQEAVWGHRNHVGYTGFRHAPVYILILSDFRVIDSYPVRTAFEKGETHVIASVAQATVMAHLAAASLGLGSQWVSDVSSPYMATMIKSWLKIPRNLVVHDMMAVGHPAMLPAVTHRRSVSEILHHDEYEADKVRTDEDVMKFLWDHTLLGGFKNNNGLKGGPTPPAIPA